MTLTTHPAFLAAGGNRHTSVADWSACSKGPLSSSGSLLAYGAGSNVALWDPNDLHRPGLRALLRGTHGFINAVKFVHLDGSDELLLLTGSAEGALQAWVQDDHSPAGFSEGVLVSSDSGAAINAIAVLEGTGLFTTAAADHHVSFWSVSRSDGKTSLILQQRLKLSPQYFALALDMTMLDDDTVVLAAAGTKPNVQILTSAKTNIDFKVVATLAGHEAWVRSLAFVRESDDPTSDLLLASSSQDRYIRLWRLHEGQDLPAMSQSANDPLLGSMKKSLSNKAHRFQSSKAAYSTTFEALLVGHEDWVFSARWSRRGDQLRLLTASADSSLSVWELDSNSGIWIAAARLGEISAQKGATTATGSAGGFWTAVWAPDGNTITCLGRTGSWRLWHRDADDWRQDFGVTGHTSSVRDISWSADGTYLLSTSSDQTTRLFSEWKRGIDVTWNELSRPQIHGYDLNCIKSLGSSRFVSGADEKLLRVFDEPKAVAQYLEALSGRKVGSATQLPDVANIPVLGLSNKAIEAETVEEGEGSKEAPAVNTETASVMDESKNKPPNEDILSKHLLWPEAEKLYGHGYEICALASNKSGSLIATACRATSLDHAVIRLYDTNTWQEIKPPLKAHTLTVTGLEFSPDDRHLLSVGRDRQCVVWLRNEESDQLYEQVASNPKAHTRMILDASWTPCPENEGHLFLTAGRDKVVSLWRQDAEVLTKLAALTTSAAVMSVACFPKLVDSRLIAAYGLEDGTVCIVTINTNSRTFSEPLNIDRRLTPAASITSIAWRPSPADRAEEDFLQLAVASEDSSLRIINVSLPRQ